MKPNLINHVKTKNKPTYISKIIILYILCDIYKALVVKGGKKRGLFVVTTFKNLMKTNHQHISCHLFQWRNGMRWMHSAIFILDTVKILCPNIGINTMICQWLSQAILGVDELVRFEWCDLIILASHVRLSNGACLLLKYFRVYYEGRT